MKDKKIDWYERETGQVTLEDIKNLGFAFYTFLNTFHCTVQHYKLNHCKTYVKV